MMAQLASLKQLPSGYCRFDKVYSGKPFMLPSQNKSNKKAVQNKNPSDEGFLA